MSKQTSEQSTGNILFLAAAFAILLLAFAYYKQNIATTCINQDIDYQVITNDDSTKASGTTTVTQAGAKGTKTKCTKQDGTIVSDSIITQPVNEVVARGTYVAPAPAPVSSYSNSNYSTGSYRTGAICRDGTRSYATGSGACSWHGGVSYWLYN